VRHLVCSKCKSDNVTTFSDAKLYYKTFWPLDIKKYINVELVYLCNECQTALLLVHIYDDYSRWNRSTAHYPSLRVSYTKKFNEEMEERRRVQDKLANLIGDYFHDGFAEYVSSRMSNFFTLEDVPVKEYRIRDIIIECSESVGECKVDPHKCKYHGQAAHDQMEKNCGIGHGFTFDMCPKLILDKTMYVSLHGHEVEVHVSSQSGVH